jgi:hypothetical protein
LKYDPATEKKAKEMAAGPLGNKLSTFPLLFAKPAFFGQRPSAKRPTEIRNGTIALIDLGNGPLGITCQHVIQGYREHREKFEEVIFNIGNVELDPISQLIDENNQLDLAVIELTEKQIQEITSEGEIGSIVFKPANWPPAPLLKDEFVMFGGFPGSLRTIESFNEIVFSSWSSGASRIDSATEYRIISPFERDYWISSFGEKHHLNITALGGMSGSPAFISRGLHFDFVGILTDYEDSYDAVFFSTVQSITESGQITPPPV